ncbi:otogelin [Spea bombifrons]|uniref:otogelin n=1 Tax=Spea bombifrons TaxID=233779 RepID=UPI00234BD96F|nr:otogelin [Spea bombifrons]
MELQITNPATPLSVLLHFICILPALSAAGTTDSFSATGRAVESNNRGGILQKEDTASEGNQELGTSDLKFQPTLISQLERRIQKAKCESFPCFNGGECVQRRLCDCSRYNASGSQCQIVYNTGAERDSICRTWAQYHFETFDGVYFFYPGRFTYDLLRQNDPDEQSFSIQVHNDPACHSFPYSCRRSVSLYFVGDGEIKLQNQKVLHNNVRIQLPYTVGSLQIQKISGYVIIRLQYVFNLAWDGNSSVYIKMSPDYVGKTQGLCGNNNGILQDDLVTSYGKPTENIEEFVNSWRESIPHEESPEKVISSYEPPCLKQSQHVKSTAYSLCSLLFNSPFQSCHESVSPLPFAASCASDLCMAEADVATWCRAVTEYARACAHAGHPLLDWRAIHKQCEVACGSDLVYSECINCCPSNCQQTKPCIDSQMACVDGCYCPEGLIFENDACVEPQECPCEFHGAAYQAGSVVQDQCNNCTCTGGKWNCTEIVCPAECSVTGDLHIRTFDGRKYSFQAPCQYILAKSISSGVFTVTLQNSLCGPNQDGSCILSINLILNQDPRRQVTLTHSGDVLKLDQYKINLPYTDDNFEIRKLSSVFVQVKTRVGLELLYDRNGLRLYLQLDGRWKDDTIGLCGTFNGNMEDDFLSPVGIPESTPQLFGNAWKVSSACASDYFTSPLDPCDVHLQAASYASESCSILTKDLFASCHPYLSPVPYYDQCRKDTCKCGQACLCSALAHYAHQCRRFGVTINFRPLVSDCEIVCEETMKYGTCVSTCGQTCHSLSVPESCAEDCVEGCACPKGKYLDATSGRCVQRHECPCYYQGIDYHPGENVMTSFGTCHCKDGAMSCDSSSDVHHCPAGQIYYNCSNPEEDLEPSQERTCENQLLNMTTSAHMPCISGCVCPRGLVKHGDECFNPDACPCSWKAKEYYPGDTVNSSCYSCVCQRGSFQCTFHPCPSMCTTYGDRHYRTFDGLAYDFVGTCKIHLVKGLLPTSFSITAENVNCYGGIICRKKISIRVGQSLIIFDDETGNPSPSSIVDKRQSLHVWQAGIFTFVHFPSEFITLLWDQRTTIHVQVGPQWQGELSGLCGNFDLKTVNEMRTPDNFDLTNVQEFGNSWTAVECADSSDIRNPCLTNPFREPFAKKECGILLSDVFEDCHPVVDVTWFYANCLSDTCGCNRGGDCECFCTSVSAYAHQCCQHGITVDWRSPRVCPYDCEYFNKVLGKGPYKLVSYLDKSLVLAARIPDGNVFPMRRDYLIPEETASFMLTPGLYKPKAHDRNLVSIELADRPNFFLHLARNGTFLISKWQKEEDFQNRSTFIMHRNAWISGYNSFECFAKPGYFLRISASYIFLTKYHHSAAFRLSTLFRLTDSKLKSPRSTCEWKYDACSTACFRTCRDPEGQYCKDVPKVEGCFPSCPPHMVLDEVTRKCVYLEDCVEPAFYISASLSTPAPTGHHTVSTTFNMTSYSSLSSTSVSTSKPEITIPKVSKWSFVTTGPPGLVTGVAPHTDMLANASMSSPLTKVIRMTPQKHETTWSQATHSTSAEMLSSGATSGILSSSQAFLEGSTTTPYSARVTEVKADTDTFTSPQTPLTTTEMSKMTLMPVIITKETSQLLTFDGVTSSKPKIPTATTEREDVTTAVEVSVPTLKTTTLGERASVTILPNFTTPLISPLITTILTSRSTTSTPSVEAKITTFLPKEGLSTPTDLAAVTTELPRTSYTTSATSLAFSYTGSTVKEVASMGEISKKPTRFLQTEGVSQTLPLSTMAVPFTPFSSPSTKQMAATEMSTRTGLSAPSLVTESTEFPSAIKTVTPTSLLTTELVSFKEEKTTLVPTKMLTTKVEQISINATQQSNMTEAITLLPEVSILHNATVPTATSKPALAQTFLTTEMEPKITTNISTTPPTFTLYPVHPSSHETATVKTSTTERITRVPQTSSIESITRVPQTSSIEGISRVPQTSSIESITRITSTSTTERVTRIPPISTTERVTRIPPISTTESITRVPQTSSIEGITRVPLTSTIEIISRIPPTSTTERITRIPPESTTASITSVLQTSTTENITSVPQMSTTESITRVPQTTTTKRATSVPHIFPTETITRVPSLMSPLPLLTMEPKMEPSKATTTMPEVMSNMTTKLSVFTEEELHITTKPDQRTTEREATSHTSNFTTRVDTLNYTGTTLHAFSQPTNKTSTTKTSTTEYKSLEITATSPDILNATKTSTSRIRYVEETEKATTGSTSTIQRLSNITGSLKSIPYTERTLFPTDFSGLHTFSSPAQTISHEAVSQPLSTKPSTTLSTKNVTTVLLSTTIMFPTIKTTVSMYKPTSKSPLPDIIRATQSTTQGTYPPFTTSLSTSYPAVPYPTTARLTTHLTTEGKVLLTGAVNITHITSLVSVSNVSTPAGHFTSMSLPSGTISTSTEEKAEPSESIRTHPPSTAKAETLFVSTKHPTGLKDLSSTEIYKTASQLPSQPSTQSKGVSETLATYQPTPAESTSAGLVTKGTSTPPITITRDTVSRSPKTMSLSTTMHGPPVVTTQVATLPVYLTPQTGYTSVRTSPSVTHGLTHVSQIHDKSTIEKALTPPARSTNYSTGHEGTEGLTSTETPLQTSHVTNATGTKYVTKPMKTTYIPSTETPHISYLTGSIQTIVPTGQKPETSSATPSSDLTTPIQKNVTVVPSITEFVFSASKTLQETVSAYSGDQTKTEGVSEGISVSIVIPSRETATSQACVPYTENDCIKHICVDGQLIQVNKSQHCPYNATQPSCGLLGFAIPINGDKCCPKWECACRCSIFSDLSFVTFDGRYLALYKEASYIFSLTEDESITAHVSKCKPTNRANRDEVTLCLSVLELTHLSNQIIIDRLNRKVTVNSRYAWPMIRKYGYKIVDTGNMYLIDTPTNVKIQWFHSTGLMIIESNATSKPTSMGLCGYCDGNTTNDFILPNGRVLGKSDDAAEFLDSWQVPYTLKYSGKERHQDVNCSLADCSECFGMILNHTFSSCHAYVSPEAFCELWVQDTEFIEDPCKALTAYSSMCHKFNICMEWRSPDYCPFECPETLRYQPCLPVCDVPRTCQNNEIDLHDTESCSALTEGCVCTEGAILHRPYSTLCIPEAKCACTDSAGIPRAIGEVWKTSLSGCCMHQCIDNETIIPVEQNCSGVVEPRCQRYGEVVVSIADPQTCCPQKVCVCNQSACDNRAPECGILEKLSSYYQDDSCCPRYICECDPEKCEPNTRGPTCRDDQALVFAHTNNSCCVKSFCACNICTNPVPKCQEGEILTVEGNFTEKCCPSYQCVCETSRCPEVTCAFGMSPVELWSPESCCPYRTCECSCDNIPKPDCKLGEKLEIDEDFLNSPSNVCNCTVYKCVKDAVCLSKERGVLRPGQTIVEHTSDGICHSIHCTSRVDPVTKYHLINVTSSNCAAKCEANQVYEPPRDLSTCCGRCKNTSCVQSLLNGTLLAHRPGTSWNSKCVKYDCTNTPVGPVLVTSAINCPPFNETECIKMGGYVVSFLDGCCKTCKEDGKFCKRVTVRMTIRKNDCRSNTPVNIVSCDGKCPSASIYNYNINTYARFCKCCRELGLQRRVVQLYCSGNSTWVNYSIQEPTDCSCQWS